MAARKRALSTVFCVSYERCASTSVETWPGTMSSSSMPTFTDSTSAISAYGLLTCHHWKSGRKARFRQGWHAESWQYGRTGRGRQSRSCPPRPRWRLQTLPGQRLCRHGRIAGTAGERRVPERKCWYSGICTALYSRLRARSLASVAARCRKYQGAINKRGRAHLGLVVLSMGVNLRIASISCGQDERRHLRDAKPSRHT